MEKRNIIYFSFCVISCLAVSISAQSYLLPLTTGWQSNGNGDAQYLTYLPVDCRGIGALNNIKLYNNNKAAGGGKWSYNYTCSSLISNTPTNSSDEYITNYPKVDDVSRSISLNKVNVSCQRYGGVLSHFHYTVNKDSNILLDSGNGSIRAGRTLHKGDPGYIEYEYHCLLTPNLTCEEPTYSGYYNGGGGDDTTLLAAIPITTCKDDQFIANLVYDFNKDKSVRLGYTCCSLF